jgi:hypothetical protein
MAYRFIYMVYDADDRTHTNMIYAMKRLEFNIPIGSDSLCSGGTAQLATDIDGCLEAAKAHISLHKEKKKRDIERAVLC